MPRNILILGGTDFAGPAMVDAALRRGDEVTVFHRGVTDAPPEGVTVVHGDRTRAVDLARLGDGPWDVVVDTWSRAPWVVRDAAAYMRDRASRYVYISTVSVYAGTRFAGIQEDAPTTAASPDAEATSYPADKRGAELAVEREFGAERSLLARAGLIVGPRENIGRLPWWLARVARGGDVLAPGPAENGLQFVDVRDLAAFALDAVISGPVNVISRPGHTSMSALLERCVAATGSDARLVWVDAAFLLEHGVEPWTELPLWAPPAGETAGFYTVDTTRAHAAGFVCRSSADTIDATWEWMRHGGTPAGPPADRRPVGLDPERETALLGAWRATSTVPDQPPAAR